MLNKEIRTNGTGATIIIDSCDIKVSECFFTSVYLALFNSHTEYWGNSVFDIELNSQTEKALVENSLDNAGIENIKRAVINDLNTLDFAEIKVNLIVVDNSKLNINIVINKVENVDILIDIENVVL